MISSCLSSILLVSALAWPGVAIAAEETALAPPSAETVAAVANEFRALLNNNSSDYGNVVGSGPWGNRGDLMGLLVRLPFHDAVTFRPGNGTGDGNLFSPVGGSDGCVDLENAENNGLDEAIDLLESIRTKVAGSGDGEGAAAMMSRADVWVLAGNVMIEEAGGPLLDYRVGRVDASDCSGQEDRHVGAETTSSERIAEVFVDALGLSHREVVALIGAHVLGKAKKANSGYEGPWTTTRNDRFTNAYFVDMLHKPWHKETEVVEPFGERTTWKRFEGMQSQKEIMLQTDVDLAFQTTGGSRCDRIGGEYVKFMTCPNATHAFSSHVWDFALDEEAWMEEFAVGWAKLTSMTTNELRCVTSDCKTPPESWEPDAPSESMEPETTEPETPSETTEPQTPSESSEPKVSSAASSKGIMHARSDVLLLFAVWLIL